MTVSTRHTYLEEVAAQVDDCVVSNESAKEDKERGRACVGWGDCGVG